MCVVTADRNIYASSTVSRVLCFGHRRRRDLDLPHTSTRGRCGSGVPGRPRADARRLEERTRTRWSFRRRGHHAEAEVQQRGRRRGGCRAPSVSGGLVAREHLRPGRQEDLPAQVHEERRAHGERRGREDRLAPGVRRAVPHHVVRARAQSGRAEQAQRETADASQRETTQRRLSIRPRPRRGVCLRRKRHETLFSFGALRARKCSASGQERLDIDVIKAGTRRRRRFSDAREPLVRPKTVPRAKLASGGFRFRRRNGARDWRRV